MVITATLRYKDINSKGLRNLAEGLKRLTVLLSLSLVFTL